MEKSKVLSSFSFPEAIKRISDPDDYKQKGKKEWSEEDSPGCIKGGAALGVYSHRSQGKQTE